MDEDKVPMPGWVVAVWATSAFASWGNLVFLHSRTFLVLSSAVVSTLGTIGTGKHWWWAHKQLKGNSGQQNDS